MTVQSSALHCIAPSEVDDDALFLVARAEAPAPVIAHVNRCPACRESVMQYQRIERLLVSALDRRSCPATLTLGEYAIDLLPPEERQRVAVHLVGCPRCAEERRDFSTFLSDDDPPPLASGIGSALKRLFLLPLAPAAGLAGLRGAATADSRTFAAEGVQLQLSVERGTPGAGAVIAGMFISGGEGAIGVPATLLRDSSTADLQPIDEFGSFLFSGVTPGDYRIEIELPGTLLVIDPLAVP